MRKQVIHGVILKDDDLRELLAGSINVIITPMKWLELGDYIICQPSDINKVDVWFYPVSAQINRSEICTLRIKAFHSYSSLEDALNCKLVPDIESAIFTNQGLRYQCDGILMIEVESAEEVDVVQLLEDKEQEYLKMISSRRGFMRKKV